MQSKRRTSTPKQTLKSQSRSKSKSKKNPSPALRDSKSRPNLDNGAAVLAGVKKKTGHQLVKKKIQQLKTPQILIKVNYKSKRITIPIISCDDRNLHDTVIPHIVRFEAEVLHNPDFAAGSICNWKTTGRSDILKDYYFQTSKPISIFKGQLLEIEPIWKPKSIETQAVQLRDFQIIKCIGTGGFSRVFLTRLKSTGGFYALKLMQKEGLFESGKECVVTNERNIMVGLKSPSIVNLQFAFETKHFVALALQYCPGGQLFYYLRKIKRMTEEEARYCFIQILLGIQYLHSQNIIYRDIKPENIMIDVQGNLKIADFGLSKEGIRANDLATTYCGSPQYMAPEMLAKSGHSYSVDYYCLGALLYELVTGNPPFYSRDVDKIYYSIQNDEIDFPSHVDLSTQIKMLLEGLLIKDPKRRLGSMGGIREILGHPWVRKLKPADIINKTVPTPIQIDLLTFNINEEEIQQGGEQFIDKIADEDSNFHPQFQEFYFNRYEQMNILDQALPSVKSDSTKENKSMKIPPSNSIKDHSKKIANGFKSSLSRQKLQKFNIEIANPNERAASEVRNCGKDKKKMKRMKSKKHLDLIERAKRRQQKSVVRGKEDKNSINRGLGMEKSPVQMKRSAAGLKRIKSSTALQTMFANNNMGRKGK